ncbi:2-isopropylmalate synthase/homocitrate synthase family protein [Denitrovibrio acetiphilus DSM 12809]|uniref:Citramalate synthase n=1 Tax=Denitrovibrio acetiphilus (strain DSM 12809 / NBRC 114555 / N2460) TaxID=522772 RepID=D4H837_DENA2|nr:citramalate synthase [Denitrovibrio acetiphilus]ADD68186.1 2-isopropylmalate synthase/homocitrate synthase family protein [Denitrovibrio acetiphilus DSM 12809]
MSKRVEIYDTTLRDGTQSEDVNFTIADKVKIAEALYDFGVRYIEGGWPGSNPRDIGFFKAVKGSSVPDDHIAAFGSTRRAKRTCDNDENIQALLEVEVPNLTIFGKTWDLHVTEALKIELDQNLELINDSLSYLKTKVDRAFYDAEHFFDGYKANKEYALRTLKAAMDAKADCIILCDTNGGTMPAEIGSIIDEVRKVTGDYPLGIHCHNDSDCAVANSVIAVKHGIVHVQGTVNGYGERCGNANIMSVIPNLQLKYGYECVPVDKLKNLRTVSRYINELGNLKHNIHQPYVGRSAFAHKGGVHVSAIMKNSSTYEHIEPELVGNRQRVLLSDLSGKSNLIYKAKDFGLDVDSSDPKINAVVERLKELENKGFQFEGAEASFELLMRKTMGTFTPFFDSISYRVIDEMNTNMGSPLAEATVMIKVDGEQEHTAAAGNGPVNAIDNAIRKALLNFYPNLKDMELVDYKVRILTTGTGTEAVTRVLVESKDTDGTWGTVGVATNIVDASYQALMDSIEYKLLKDKEKE